MASTEYKTPGVYAEELPTAAPVTLRTGVPGFVGFVEGPTASSTQSPPSLWFTRWSQFKEHFAAEPDFQPHVALDRAVRGFFENGGSLCCVSPVPIKPKMSLTDQSVLPALLAGLDALALRSEIDLVCVPEIMGRYVLERAAANPRDPQVDALTPQGKPVDKLAKAAIELQRTVLVFCERLDDRVALLDAFPDTSQARVAQQPTLLRDGGQSGRNGALYYPWVDVGLAAERTETNRGLRFQPPCGHVAGIIARSDQTGVFKSPANEPCHGVVGLQVSVTNEEQKLLNPIGINCIRAFPGRGIRVWGARTLVGSESSPWKYINVRRLFLTLGRWIELNMASLAFEPHDQRLWARLGREITAHLNTLFRQGGLQGNSPEEAFFVKCDAETNPREVRDQGMVVTEIGLAPAVPAEFIVVRVVQSNGGVHLSEPVSQPAPTDA